MMHQASLMRHGTASNPRAGAIPDNSRIQQGRLAALQG